MFANMTDTTKGAVFSVLVCAPQPDPTARPVARYRCEDASRVEEDSEPPGA